MDLVVGVKRIYISGDGVMTIEELPEVLNVSHVQKFLGISKNAAYELVNSKSFHVVKIGRIYKIPKKSFAQWFEGQKIS